jgi:NifU-like protein involved in Fe-S cluster formation
MPCSDSSSGLNIRLTSDERLDSFQFAKITCSSEIGGSTGLSAFCKGKSMQEIMDLDFYMLRSALNLNTDEEAQFILYLELDALKAGIAQYLGIEHPSVDADRCSITAIEYTQEYIEIAEVILPPKELPKILPCSLKDR